MTQAGPLSRVALSRESGGLPGTVWTRAGPRAAGLSRRCTGRPDAFYVPRGPARCSRVGARGPWRLPLPGSWGTGPRWLRPCGRPTFVDGLYFFFFFFFFCRVEAPSDSQSSLTIRPTLGKACSLELSTLVTRGNAVKQTAGCWSLTLLGAPPSVQA